MLTKDPLQPLARLWVAFVIPVIVTVISILLKLASGPYWQFPDPSYGYLLSSLSIVKTLTTTFTDHPGTPVSILGAVIISLSNLGRSAADTVHRVLIAPDHYLNAISVVMIAFVFLSSLCTGVYIYRRTGDKLACFLSQLPVLTFLSLRSCSSYEYVLPVVTNVSPEPLLISISFLFSLFLLKLYFAKDLKEETLAVLSLGFICGLGIAARLTFIPFLLLPLIFCRWPFKFLFVFVFVLSCVLWTIPVISSYALIWSWLIKLLTHVGRHGSGAQGFVMLPQYLTDWRTMLGRCGYLTAFALIAGGLSLIQAVRSRTVSREAGFFFATAFCILAQFALIAKHYDDHYLVAVISMFSPLFVFFYLSVKNKGVVFKAAVSVYIFLFIMLSIGQALIFYKQLSGFTNDAVSFHDRLLAKYPDYDLVGIFPMPMLTPQAAFFWGNDRDTSVQDELANLYPKSLAYFDNYSSTNSQAAYLSGIYQIKHRVWAEDLLEAGAQVVLLGPKGYDFSQSPYKVTLLEQGKYAAAYLLTGSTEKQADHFFVASFKLAQAGDFPHAFAFALKSRELHYQPVQKVDLLLSMIYQSIKH